MGLLWLRDNDQEHLLTVLTAPKQLHLSHRQNINYVGVGYRWLTLDLIKSKH